MNLPGLTNKSSPSSSCPIVRINARSISGPLPSDAPKSLYGLLASKRMARRIAVKAYAKRANSRITEPTYRMSPKRKFSATNQAYDTIKSVVDKSMEQYVYQAGLAPKKCKIIIQEVQDAVKRLHFDRYKFVCTCCIAREDLSSSLQQSSRSCWNTDTDSYVTYTYSRNRVFCTVTVYAVYHE